MSSVDGVDYSRLQELGLGQQEEKEKKAPRNELKQEDFMTLMLAQLKNQDPMSPMENEEFLAQLAQMNSSTGIQKLNESFEQFVESQQSNRALEASTLVGRSVLVNSETAALSEGGSVSGMVDVPSSTSEVTVGVYDGTGQLVRTMNLGPQAAGRVGFDWDGRADDGTELPPGTYTFSADAQSGGKTEAVDTIMAARVDSVTLERNGKEPTLNLQGLGSVQLSEIREVM